MAMALRKSTAVSGAHAFFVVAAVLVRHEDELRFVGGYFCWNCHGKVAMKVA